MNQSSDIVTRSSMMSEADSDTALGAAFDAAALVKQTKAQASTTAEQPAAEAPAKPARTRTKAAVPAKAKPVQPKTKPAPAVTRVPEGVSGREARFANPATGRNTSELTPITIESLKAVCPNPRVVAKIIATFALPDVDFDAVFKATLDGLMAMDKALPLADKAREIHQERITRAFLVSANGACSYYQTKATQAREMNTRMLNESGTHTSDGSVGFESTLEKAQNYAADLAVQAFTLTTVAMAAVEAYEQITGNTYRPYTRTNTNAPAVSRAITKARAAALG